LAAVSIVAYHAAFYSRPAGDSVVVRWITNSLGDLAFGVTLFFTLSGFLLYRPFVASLLRGKTRPSLAEYLRNRAFRILPAYWAIFLISALILQTTWTRTSEGGRIIDGIDDPVTLAKHLLLVQSYDPSTVATGISPAWSVTVEAVFYLALPLLALTACVLARRASTRWGRTAAALVPPLLLLGGGLAVKTALDLLTENWSGGWAGDWYSVLVRSFLCQADLFSFGMALAVVRVDAEDGLIRVGTIGRRTIAAFAVAAYLVTAQMTGPTVPLGISRYNTVIALVCALFLALVVLPSPGANRPALVRILELRPFVAIGLVSYSLFLWHEPLLYWLAAHQLAFTGRLGFVATFVIVLVVGFVLSLLSYRLVELPAIRRGRHAHSSRRVVDRAKASDSAAP
jgi:peptidoglycan/LPS O-acetylase OafA/YrhL